MPDLHQALSGNQNKLVHRVHGFARVGDVDGEAAVAEVHEAVRVDDGVLGLLNCKNPPCEG